MTGIPHPGTPGRRYIPRMPKRHVRDDLFAIFPDLPWHAHKPSTGGQMERAQRHVKDAQIRVGQNIQRQRETTARVRAAIARRHLGNN